MDWRERETFSFGDGPALAHELAALVLDGRKRATCWADSDGLLTEVGKRMVMLDGEGRPRAVVETVELTQCPFNEVDEQRQQQVAEWPGANSFVRPRQRPPWQPEVG